MYFLVAPALTLTIAAADESVFPASPSLQVGDTVTHPVTGVNSTVAELVLGRDGSVDSVLTANGDLILTKLTVGATLQPIDEDVTYVVVSVALNATTNLVETANVRPSTADDEDPTTPVAAVVNINDLLDQAAADNAGTADVPGQIDTPAASGRINETSTGTNGGNGSNAYGVRVAGVTIAKEGSAGRPVARPRPSTVWWR